MEEATRLFVSGRFRESEALAQELVRENGDQVDAIAGVSATALDNMEKLRGDLPVIANSARDVTNRIGSAGQTAQEQLEGLVAGFERLKTFGEASEGQVMSLSERLDGLLQLSEAATTGQSEQEGEGGEQNRQGLAEDVLHVDESDSGRI